MSDLVERARREGSFVSANGVVRELYFKMIDEIERLSGNLELCREGSAIMSRIHDKHVKRIAKLEAELKLYRPSGELLMNTLATLQEVDDE